MKLDVVTYLTKATLTQSEVAEAISRAVEYLATRDRVNKAVSAGGQSLTEQLCQYALDRGLGLDQLPADLPGITGCVLIRLVPLYAAKSSRMLREQSVYRLLNERFTRKNIQILCRQNDIALLFLGGEAARPDDYLGLIDSVNAYARLHFDLALHAVDLRGGLSWENLPDALTRVRSALDQPYLFDRYAVEISQGGELRIPELDRLLGAVRTYAEHALPKGPESQAVLDSLGRLRFIPQSKADFLARWAQLTAQLCEAGADLPPARLIAAHTALMDAEGLGAMLKILDETLTPLICPTEGWSGRQLDIAIHHMLQNLREDLTLGGVAAVAQLSPGYFSTLLKDRSGMRFSEYLAELRLEKARQLLQNPALSVAQVGERCGYSDTAYFCRRFKQSTGKSPGQWRKK